MNRIHRLRHVQLGCAMVVVFAASCSGTILKLKSGMEIRGNGSPGKIADLGANVLASPGNGPKSIYVVDDGLKRTFVSTYQVDGYRDDLAAPESIRIKQPVARSGKLASMGPLATAPTGFDQWGRRTATLISSGGAVEVVQGITEVTPTYTRVQGLQADRPFVLDMRLRTSSIPGDVLTTVLKQQLDLKSADDRLGIVRLFLQSGRYGDAKAELEATIEDFPELTDLKKQLVDIRRLEADKHIAEIELRKKAGQHQLVSALLRQFPTKDVGGKTLATVSELDEKYQAASEQIRQVLELVDSLLADVKPGPRRQILDAFRDELGTWLSSNTLKRMNDLLRLLDDNDLDGEKKLALALSGWLLDGGATDDMATATSLWTVRGLTWDYLNSTDAAERDRIVSLLQSEQAGTPSYVARLLAAMRPPRALPTSSAPADAAPNEQPASTEQPTPQAFPGLHSISVPGIKPEETFEYLVQLPPEYDPHRKYPAIVTLHGSATNPQLQLDWWAGAIDTKQQLRTGQASRRGYIVIAPAWAADNQREYHYSAREHAAVLFSLRDAFQRFSIQTDRVYLSGHSMGGDAAWDIALAHPDLWAGAIPIVATAVREGKRAPKYVSLYWKNARNIPLLFIGGSLDGNRMRMNARDLNRYLTRAGFDTTVVEYKGRGHEHFHEEIHDIFRWMEFHTRDFFRAEFAVNTMRPWDSFFWWLEVGDLPSKSVVLPAAWPPAKGTGRAAAVSGVVRGGNTISIKSGAAETTLWLSPDLINLDQPIDVLVNGRKRRFEPTPDVAVLLEDARTRGDRLRPFWSKLELTTGRASR